LFIDAFGMMFRRPLDAAHRHLNPVVFLQLRRRRRKSVIRPKIRHHPLQR
jgi:hypothetical protein